MVRDFLCMTPSGCTKGVRKAANDTLKEFLTILKKLSAEPSGRVSNSELMRCRREVGEALHYIREHKDD